MDGSVKERLLALLKEKKMSQSEFTRQLGVSPTYIGAMRKSMPEERLKKVYEMFPDLNRNWLQYGEGDMLIDPNHEVELARDYVVPLLPVEAYAGNLQEWSFGVQLRDCEKVVSPVPGVDFGIRVTGNSMEPEFPGGSMLFIKRLKERTFIPWGNPMVIDTENGVLIKLLYPGDGSSAADSTYVEARSLNPNYPPFKIPVDSIYGIYRVVTGIRDYSVI